MYCSLLTLYGPHSNSTQHCVVYIMYTVMVAQYTFQCVRFTDRTANVLVIVSYILSMQYWLYNILLITYTVPDAGQLYSIYRRVYYIHSTGCAIYCSLYTDVTAAVLYIVSILHIQYWLHNILFIMYTVQIAQQLCCA